MTKQKTLMAILLVAVSLTVACGGSGDNFTTPPIPTPEPTAQVTKVLGFKVWRSGPGCESLPNPACEVAPNADGSFTLHNYAGGYFEGKARFVSGCTVIGRYWSDPAESLLEAQEDTMPETELALIFGGGDHNFVSGGFRYRPANDPRHADPATLHIRTVCSGVELNGDIVIHQVE